MSQNDAFGLKNSGLNPFLFADVGIERNGSSLTILSVLARLGLDPWTEAARWATLPRAAGIDNLARDIAQMPLCPEALLDARATASRLILLLPGQVRASGEDAPAKRQVLLVTALYCALAIGLAASTLLHQQTPAPATLSQQSVQPAPPPR